ncbi:unnamed protein product [Zymoseptoria tritici ST99CH_1A5]|uniref:Uncharacterized protein n=1 Tax=Zymoseptoria tritici ST99CH_1A5 TaxID=1276529 RepID=A0A1Y6LMN6_ZYMTR|nr:unnamed protein product [Zymoseptoria tritici ST99CH_3D1]SMY25676.1 unnamed protein product [Zymoseptoria tritici ST99CH_1A5]
MANNEGIRGLREQIFDNAAFLYPDAIIDHCGYQAGNIVKPSEIFSIVMLKQRKPMLDAYGHVQQNVVLAAPVFYQAVVMHGELTIRKIAARSDQRDTVHEALESLLGKLARLTALKVFHQIGCNIEDFQTD